MLVKQEEFAESRTVAPRAGSDQEFSLATASVGGGRFPGLDGWRGLFHGRSLFNADF
jgi:hypothetical protein